MKIKRVSFLRLTANFLYYLILITAGGCQTPNGLIKTPLTDYTRTRYASLGISIELPKQSPNVWARYTLHIYDSSVYQTNTHVRAELVVGMHPLWSGSLNEPMRLISLHVVRLTAGEFDEYLQNSLNGLYGYGDAPEQFHEVVRMHTFKDKNDWCRRLIIRRDIKLENGEFVVGIAKLADDDGLIPDKDEDIKKIEKILNSMQPLEQ